MRKIALLLSLVVGLMLPALAQKDKRASDILDAMSAKYKSLGSYQTAFTYTAGKESYKGDLTVKATKFRLKLAGQEVFNDGKTMATYVKESNEVNIQDYDDSANGEFNPTVIYSIYKKGFSYKFLKETQQAGRTLEVIELTPEKKKSRSLNCRLASIKLISRCATGRLPTKTGS